jgi:hypothetical protein
MGACELRFQTGKRDVVSRDELADNATFQGQPTLVNSSAFSGSNYFDGASRYFSARGCSDSTPLKVLTGNRQPVCL